ncbi:TIGR03086 family metal-binding protein [Streptosporangium subroseum]|nr:TIGR03086 family metal-binding protein [Streptosporangium subroseum]
MHAVRGDQWADLTPCAPWTVRELVQHVVWTHRWTPPLLSGESLEEVGSRFEGDLLGDDPVATWDNAELESRKAAAATEPGKRIVTLYGDLSAREYLELVTSEVCVHTWDLARSIGDDDVLDPELVGEVTDRYLHDRLYGGGAPAESWSALFRPPMAGMWELDPQGRLIALVGRDPSSRPVI